MTTTNHQFRLASRPVGLPERSNWTYTEEGVSEPEAGMFLVKNLYISIDPGMRGWMNAGKSYIAPVGIGDVMRALAVGRVVASNHPDFAVDEFVVGLFGVQEYAYSDGLGIGVTKVDATRAPLPLYLSTLGMTGLTAYFGLLTIGQPKEGETVVVSAAAGSVGMVVGQIAKIKGCRVVGIAGGAQKCAYLVKELGFDAAIDYHSQDVEQELHTQCPQGIDVYFDNVGGEILDAALTHLAPHARVVICGSISQFNSTTAPKGPANYMGLHASRASMTGLQIAEYTDHFVEAGYEMAGWMQAGKLKSREDIVDGLETFPETFLKLFRGENIGKLLIKVSEA